MEYVELKPCSNGRVCIDDDGGVWKSRFRLIILKQNSGISRSISGRLRLTGHWFEQLRYSGFCFGKVGMAATMKGRLTLIARALALSMAMNVASLAVF